ncbi:unnamed protein product [Phyllotreta striolata]|uniref:Pyridoxal kinase n=1 Tax=Phyllotreta striolata TaxID=444603 RepID=A0A9N9XL69_PHYSR|nr:unnamed protein product [Phyllotreta striolata]
MEARVLSIQSHVVSGYVGNKSAVFPMQVLGLDVDFINSVQFSNHTGYKVVKGQILTEKELDEIITGLKANGLDIYTHLLTGYIGSKSFLCQIINVVKELKKKNPNLIYVCDPVMGDNGKLYVPNELLPIYRESVIQLADIITPNLFEAELLSEVPIEDISDVWKAVDVLHNKGCETIIISSADIKAKPGILYVFASRKKEKNEKYLMELNKYPNSFTGTGDLFASLMLSWMHKTKNDLKKSLEYTIASLQSVLKKTLDNMQGKGNDVKNKELRIIQSKTEIEEPKVIYEAVIVE